MANEQPSIYGDFIRHGHQAPGGTRRRGWGARAAWLGGGVAMLSYGASRRSGAAKWLSYLGGGAMIAAGAVSRAQAPLRLGTRMGAWRSDIAERLQETEWSFIEANVVIDRPLADVYGYLHDVSNWPRIFTGIAEAHVADDGELTYAIQVSPTRAIWWRGRFIEDYPEQLITWQSASDNVFDETGSLRFDKESDSRTKLTLAASFRIGAGIPGMVAGQTLGRLTEEVTQSDLDNLKKLLERQPQPVGAR